MPVDERFEGSGGFFIQLPRLILKDSSISSSAKLLLGEVINLLRVERRFCYASNAYFSRSLGLKPTTVSDHLKQLNLAGWVTIQVVTSCDDPACPLNASGNHRHISPGQRLTSFLEAASGEPNERTTPSRGNEGTLPGKSGYPPGKKWGHIKDKEKDDSKKSAKQSAAEPLDGTTLKDETIVVASEWQARADRITRKLASKPSQRTSVLAVCRDHPAPVTDAALANAIDFSNARDRTQVFLYSVAKSQIGKG